VEDKEKLSLLSRFMRDKIKAKGWSKKEFAVNAGLDETYVYKFLSGKRDFTPTDETLGKMIDALELAGEDREYIFEIARRERESGSFIYDEGAGETGQPPVPPAEPLPETVPSETDPSPSSPAEPPTAPEVPPESVPPEILPEPVPDPVTVPPETEHPPVPQPAPSLQPWWMQLPSLLLPAGMVSWIERNRKIFIIGSVLLIAFLLGGCCMLAVILSPLGI